MKPESQRIGIAEACGLNVDYEQNKHDSRLIAWRGSVPTVVPDYLNDLNAMHEAEKVLTDEQLPFYVAILKNPVLMKEEGVSDFDIVHSTAAQRAQAFLRTIGKWVD